MTKSSTHSFNEQQKQKKEKTGKELLPSVAVIKNILQYSRSLEVKSSKSMGALFCVNN